MLFKISKIFSIATLVFLTVIAISSCRSGSNSSKTPERIDVKKASVVRAVVKEGLPHQIKAYTQGLFFHNNKMYESSGQYGDSYFAQIDPVSGKNIKSFKLDKRYFAEGATVLNSKLYILTWMEKVVLVYDIDTFIQEGTLHNPRLEGWGLTTDGKSLIMSDGSSNLFFMDSKDFREIKKISVSMNGTPVGALNELEYINGEIWANVYQQDAILIIDPDSGAVRKVIDCRNILPMELRASNTDVLNGIAYNPDSDKIYITGKYWPMMYVIMNPH